MITWATTGIAATVIADTTVLPDLPPDNAILFTLSRITVVIVNKYFGEIDSDLSLSREYASLLDYYTKARTM